MLSRYEINLLIPPSTEFVILETPSEPPCPPVELLNAFGINLGDLITGVEVELILFDLVELYPTTPFIELVPGYNTPVFR